MNSLMNELEKLKEEINKEFQCTSKKLSEALEKVMNSSKVQKEMAKNKIWKPEEKEEYWCITEFGETGCEKWDDVSYDDKVYEIGNCFKTEKEAKETVEKIKIYAELKRLAEEINTEPIDWNNKNQYKFDIAYDFKDHKLIQDWWKGVKRTGIYSTNQSFLVIAKERIGEEKLLKLFKED